MAPAASLIRRCTASLAFYVFAVFILALYRELAVKSVRKPDAQIGTSGLMSGDGNDVMVWTRHGAISPKPIVITLDTSSSGFAVLKAAG